jgi:hypothetical protein
MSLEMAGDFVELAREGEIKMPTRTQTLILWAILAAPDGGLMQKDARPAVTKPDRDALIRAGLVAVEKRGRGLWLEATDKGWSWAANNLDAALPERTTAGAVVLQAWLARLKAYLAAGNLALADVLAPRGAPLDLRAAYLRLTGGRFDQRVRLAELRAALASLDRAALDAALKAAHGRDGLYLSASDNPPELTAADRDAALDYKGERMTFLRIAR